MLLAAVGSTAYDAMLVAHILAAFIGFSPVFVHPFVRARVAHSRSDVEATLVDAFVRGVTWVYAPAIVLAGLLGFGLAGLSDDVYNLTDPWLTAAVIVWLLQVATLLVVVLPGERAVTRGDAAAGRIVGAGQGALVVLLVVMLWLMTFKPGA